MESKSCSSCGIIKDLSLFTKDCRKKTGVTSKCSQCTKEYKARWNIENGDKQRSLKRAYYQENKEVFLLRSKTWKEANREKKRASNRDWNNRNKTLKNLYTFMRRKRHKQATPSWLNETDILNIAAMYNFAKQAKRLWSVEHHVDHIVPLKGALVSGLHVPWNLQVIPAELNRTKSNKM